ncbi:MAG TPA: PDZ domain-containing protein, partial [bacterium]|nr:PDZ domain-containing protein [bacterium]
MSIGYFQEPAVRGDVLVFLSDDDLWRVSLTDMNPQRITASRGMPGDPRISPDGCWLAFTGNEEGTREVYVMPIRGGTIRRLTYTGFTGARAIGWTPDSRNVLYTTHAESPFRSWNMIHRVGIDDGISANMNVGWGSSLDFGPEGGMVLGRFGRDPAQWKRYRGGRRGEIWIDPDDSGTFHRLLDLESNLAWPMWVRDRIIFLGDHDGTGNLYSCRIDGGDLTQLTYHDDYYVRNPKTDGESVVYQVAGKIWRLDLDSGQTSRIELDLPSTFPQRQRKMPDLKRYVESYDVHPKNCSGVAVARGKVFQVPHWSGPVGLHGETDGSIRYRLARWLNDGERIVAVTDVNGDERAVVFNTTDRTPPEILEPMPLGRPNSLTVIPGADVLVMTNHRHEILQVDLETRTCQILDRSEYHRLTECDVSSDGRWIAYPCSIDPHRVAIKIYDRDLNRSTVVTEPLLWDRAPAFDPEGKYLYFLSARMFDPVRDVLDFGYSFPRGVIPMALPLRREFLNPFEAQPESPCDSDAKSEDVAKKAESTGDAGESASGDEKQPEPVIIELEDIAARAVAMPVIDGRFEDLKVTAGKVWMLEYPISGTLSDRWPPEPSRGGALDYWDLKAQNRESYASGVTSFSFSRDRKVIAYRTRDGLRVLDASKKPSKDGGTTPGRKTGWIDLSRLKVMIEPGAEWIQMYRETWRLMRDHYFAEDMSGVDWDKMYERYLPLVERCGTRSELSDVIWECIGETGTSHAYEFGGDYEPPPRYTLGKLGADLQFDAASGRYIFTHIVRGDTWNPNANSPLNQPGIHVQPG